MSDESSRGGQVQATPEGGPIDEGTPATAPGAGQVQMTPEGGPSSVDDVLTPPTWRQQMEGSIPGLEDAAAARGAAAATSPEGAPVAGTGDATRPAKAHEELRKWPPYTGKPVSEVRWDALRYAAPVAAKAEEFTIVAIDVTGKGLSRLARYLEARRRARREEQQGEERGAR
jgi:hypothetical protein